MEPRQEVRTPSDRPADDGELVPAGDARGRTKRSGARTEGRSFASRSRYAGDSAHWTSGSCVRSTIAGVEGRGGGRPSATKRLDTPQADGWLSSKELRFQRFSF